jgi:hypothetical protein
MLACRLTSDEGNMNRTLLIATAFLLTAASAPGADFNTEISPGALSAAPGDCPQTAATLAAERARNGLFQRLDELPSADMYSAVYRRDARGCESPIIIRSDVGRR